MKKRLEEWVAYCREWTKENMDSPSARPPRFPLTAAGDFRSHPFLGGIDLRGAFLEGLNFAGANLRGARLDDVSAQGVSFTEADLAEASFKEAILCGASFQGALIEGCSFDGALIEGADFRDAVGVETASFRGAWIEPRPGMVIISG